MSDERPLRRAPGPVPAERTTARLVSNPPNPWQSTHVEWLGEPPAAELQIFEETAKEIIAENDSPDVAFRFGVNPYRGCYHGCCYCYARPSHQWLGFGAGTDFDRKIVVKTNAAEALRRAFSRNSWRGDVLVFSGNTDCYQPLEASYGLTRACLEVCLEHRNPAGVITKSALVRRDAALLAELARVARARVYLSIPVLDADAARALEPHAATPEQRFETLRRLKEAGVPVGVSVSPIIPGLTDPDIPEILRRAREAGAERAFMILLRLPAEVRPVFEERMARAFPLRVERIKSALFDMRGGRLNDPRFGSRMRGEGPRAEAIAQLFRKSCARLGYEVGERFEDEAPTTFRRPGAQGELFP